MFFHMRQIFPRHNSPNSGGNQWLRLLVRKLISHGNHTKSFNSKYPDLMEMLLIQSKHSEKVRKKKIFLQNVFFGDNIMTWEL